MKKTIILLLLLINFSIITAEKEDITFTLQQQEYYFKVGTPATLELETQNTYGKNISGQLTTTMTQEINQQGIFQSTTSSNSIPIKILTEKNKIGITFGTSETQTTWNIKLSFEYYEQENRAINMENIKIHFIQEDPQEQNQQSQQQSSSQPQQSQQQNELQNQMEKIKQQSSQTQNKLTNSQTPQDSSALKQQMQQQAKQAEQEKEAFKKTLEQNEQFQQEHQKMVNQGYQMKDMEMNPGENNSGDFKINYEKENGNEAQISGEMRNGQLENLQTSTSEERQEALNQLQQNEKFQKISKQLQNENFSPQNTTIEKNNNETTIQMQYTNEKNQTATITAKIKNQAIQEIKLEKDNSKPWYWIITILILLAIFFTSYKLYEKFQTNNKQQANLQTTKPKPYNYKKASRQLLTKSKKLFQQKRHKDAYESASQAIRLFLSHKHNLKTETTNDEIIKHLRSKNQNTSSLKNTLDLCSLVEFAKYSPNQKDFNKIFSFAENLIK